MSFDYIMDKMTVAQVGMYREHMELAIEGKQKIYADQGITVPKDHKPGTRTIKKR